MEHRLEGRIDVQPRKARDWRLAVIGGGILAIAGMLVTLGAVYQLQKTGDERRTAPAVVRPAPPADLELEARRADARTELDRLRAQREHAEAKAWRDRVDRESDADEIRCYSGVRMVRNGREWVNAGRC